MAAGRACSPTTPLASGTRRARADREADSGLPRGDPRARPLFRRHTLRAIRPGPARRARPRLRTRVRRHRALAAVTGRGSRCGSHGCCAGARTRPRRRPRTAGPRPAAARERRGSLSEMSAVRLSRRLRRANDDDATTRRRDEALLIRATVAASRVEVSPLPAATWPPEIPPFEFAAPRFARRPGESAGSQAPDENTSRACDPGSSTRPLPAAAGNAANAQSRYSVLEVLRRVVVSSRRRVAAPEGSRHSTRPRPNSKNHEAHEGNWPKTTLVTIRSAAQTGNIRTISGSLRWRRAGHRAGVQE